eukprot:CAMPEP_0204397874 /NCGR_PEP_ID=MMETSP0470-20130426/2414_1 /ASSEMBLY_ACC=CAM_ASM_000385 /TAXON_ID=2969 /ORGANISM="Oxyrrhis marina" /LENGTH=827 /DNA_ID=CAMNT_0051392367 /DNA_START=925 /DNA_END=3409 /DNA_ORIENTATION=-
MKYGFPSMTGLAIFCPQSSNVVTKYRVNMPAPDTPVAAAEQPGPPEKKPKLDASEPGGTDEHEKDDVPDTSSKTVTGKCYMNPADATVDAVVGENGVLTGLTAGFFQHTAKGVRANVGVKSGRHYFEVQIIEWLVGSSYKTRIGVSTAEVSLYALHDERTVGFESDGRFVCQGSATMPNTPGKARPSFTKGDTVGLLLNLQADGESANTVSLFKNGVRATPPMPLPDCIRGKVLFPTVVYKCATVRVNLGPSPLTNLPFTVRMVGAAKESDVSMSSLKTGGAPEAVVPVGLPNSGVLDWVDAWMTKNTGAVEVSSRSILNWLEVSGLTVRRSGGSAERPIFQVSGAPSDHASLGLADGKAQRQLLQAASLQQKSVVVLEISENLRKQWRTELLSTVGPSYKTTAVVVAGEPSEEIKERARDVIRKRKRAEFDRMVAARRVQKTREKAARQHKRKLEKLREEKINQAKEQAAKLAAEKKAAAAKRAAAAAAAAGGETAPAEEEVVAEPVAAPAAAKPDVESEEEADEPDPEFKDDTDYSKIKLQHRDVPDVAPTAIEHAYREFSWPDSSEGFSKIEHAWGDANVASQCMEDLVLERKKLEKRKVAVNKWFKDKVKEWNEAINDWKRIQKTKSATPNDSELGVGEPDIWSVEDVKDTGSGLPLFKSFQAEDWALLNLRFEMHAMIHAFRQEVGEDHPGIHPETFVHYYTTFFGKGFSYQMYGQDNLEDIARLLGDTLSADDDTGCLLLGHPDETPLETFIKLTEEARRDRLARIEAGDETAKLKMNFSAGKGLGKGWMGKGAALTQGATGLRSVPYRAPVVAKSFGKGR